MITIIIPVYKVELYIEKCLNSVFQQTYSGNLECLIIDDATPDRSISIVNSFLTNNQKDNINVRIIHHKINKGLSAARNTGIINAKGNYVYFLDSDDYLDSDCILKLTKILDKYPDSDIIQAGAISTNKNLSLKDNCYLPEHTNDKNWIKKAILKRDVIPVTSWNKLVRRDFIIKNNLFFKEGIVHEDEYWNFFVCKYISSLSICKHDTYHYITREGSIMNSNNNKSIESWLIILEDFIKNIDIICRNEQITHIFKRLHPMYVFYPRLISNRSAILLNELSHKCTIIGKITIWCILHFPFIINRNKIIYKKLINNILLPLF